MSKYRQASMYFDVGGAGYAEVSRVSIAEL
jgi:hypothetical protein